MVRVSFLLLSLLFGNAEEVTASVLARRQGSAVVTKFSTVFNRGDASSPRSAASGFDIRVDIANSAWGFCATSNPGQCDMVGTCFDNSGCSSGCGPENPALKSLTCSNSANPFCYTGFLTIATDDPRAFTYVACAERAGKTDHYSAFTTPFTTPSSSTAKTTSPGTSISTSTPTTPTSPPSSTSGPSGNSSSNNNTPAIVGAVLGGIALICACIVAVFLIRRKLHTSAPAANPTDDGGGGGQGSNIALAPGRGPAEAGEVKDPLLPVPPGYGLEGHNRYVSGQRGPWGRGTAPVELPGEGQSGVREMLA